jgi:outer membrane protein assembly factor BamB
MRDWAIPVLLCFLAGTGFGEPAVAARDASPAEAATAARVEGLIRQVESGTPSAQVAAADQLGRMGEAARAAVPALLQAMAGRSSWVDLAMSEALAELSAVSLPWLADRIRNGDAAARLQAVKGLMRMGAKAKEVRPILIPLAQDKDEALRRLATRIVEGMDAEIAAPVPAPLRETADVPITGATAPSRHAGGPVRDWGGFRGPNRDGICLETGLLREWPSEGLKLLWRLDTLGRGLSGVSIAKGRLFTTADREANGEKAQYAVALDLATRSESWAARLGGVYADYGALSTPTVDESSLYVTTTDGGLACLNADDGTVRWRKHLVQDFGGAMMHVWRWSESPLVDGEKLIVTPGGAHAMVVALNKRTGETVWTCATPALGPRGKDGAGYCSAAVAEVDGVRQYVQVVGRGLIGVAADSGRFLWGYNRLASDVANIPSPVVRGGDVFTANGYNTGSARLRLQKQGDGFRVEELYVLPPATFQNHHGGVVLVGDYLYGGSGTNRGEPTCIEFATGRVMWKVKALAPGSACVLYADGHVLFRYDRGLVAWIEANPAAFRVKGALVPPRSEHAAWAYPAIHDGRLYLRDQNLLLCYALRAE